MSAALKMTFLGLLITALAGCGYTVRRDEFAVGVKSGEQLPTQRIFIPVVDNLTTRTGIEPVLTNSLRESVAVVKGAQVVADENMADYLLLTKIMSYTKTMGPTPTTGDNTTQPGGGLLSGENAAHDIRVTLRVEAELLQRVKNSGDLRRIIWVRNFSQLGTYDTSQRFSEVDGSSAAPHINNSRELVEVKLLAENLSKQIVDQLTQDF